MKFVKSALSLALACSALTVATILTPDSEQPPCAYPVGQSGGANAKVAGRLFDIDGKVEYFAGETPVRMPQRFTEHAQDQMPGGLLISA